MWVATKLVFDQAWTQTWTRDLGALLQLFVQVGFGALIYLGAVLLCSGALRREVGSVWHRLRRN
jgi:hypothetical protein